MTATPSATTMTATHSAATIQPAFFGLTFSGAASDATDCVGTCSVGSSSEGSITEGSEDIDAVQGPYAHEDAPHDVALLDEVLWEEPRILGIRPVVAHDVVRVWRHRDHGEGRLRLRARR